MHPMVKANFDARYALGQLEEVETVLERLKGAGLFTPDLRKRLQKSTQFLDTMAEVHTAIRLLDCGLKPTWGSPRPDIVLVDQDTNIEVKRLHASQNVRGLFEEAKGEVIEVDCKDSTGRLKSMIDERVPKMLKTMSGPFVLVVQAEDLDFEEFKDVVLNGPNRDGMFYDPENEKISAVVKMDRSVLLQGSDGSVTFRAAKFKGIPNPSCKTRVPRLVGTAFDIAPCA